MGDVADNPLVFACFVRRPTDLRNSIQAGHTVNAQDKSNKRTALHAAAYIGNVECCQVLVEAGASINVKDVMWVTPLHLACHEDKEECVDLLLNNGADAGSRDKKWQTPVHIAASQGHLEICQRLVAAGGPVQLKDRQGRHPLHLAAFNGFADTVEYLLSQKASPGATDRAAVLQSGGQCMVNSLFKISPFDFDPSIISGRTLVVELLLAAKSDEGVAPQDETTCIANAVDKNGCSPLHAAAAQGSCAVIAVLINVGNADVAARDLQGRTALHYAASSGDVECVEVLVEAMAQQGHSNVHMADGSGQTPLHKAAQAGDTDSITFLLDCGAPIGSKDGKGRTPAHLACVQGDLEAFDLLLEKSAAGRTVADSHGNGLVHCAAKHGHLPILTLLRIYEHDLTRPGQHGMTPLHMAALHGQESCVRFLFKHSVDHNVVDDNGRRAVHAAAFGGHNDTIRFFAGANVDCNVLDSFGRTPLHYAAGTSSAEGCEIIAGLLSEEMRAKVDALGRTPLHYAASSTQPESFKFFMRPESRGSATQGDKCYVTAIHIAAWFGNTPCLAWLLDCVASDLQAAAANACDKDKRTPLHYAACAGHPDAVACLLAIKGIDVNVTDVQGRTPLDAAAFHGHPECCGHLLEYDAEVNVYDSTGRTPVMAAAARGRDEALEVLVGSAAADDDDSDEEDDEDVVVDVAAADRETGRNALMLAVLAGSLESVACLLHTKKCDINATDKQGMTVLHLAISCVATAEDPETIKSILEQLASHPEVDLDMVDNFGRSLVHLAAMCGCDDVLGTFCERGAVNMLDHAAHTPLDYACYFGQDSCVSVLLDEGVVYANAASSVFGPLHCAAYRGHTKCIEMVFDELEADDIPDVNAGDEGKRTPLHLAALSGSVDSVDVLLSVAKDSIQIDARDVEGNTPLLLAAARGHYDVCVSLIDNDADVTVSAADGSLCTHLAFADTSPAGAVALLHALFKKHESKIADVLSHTNHRGQTVLHLAAHKHDADAVDALIAAGASLTVADQDGLLPIHHLLPDPAGRTCLDRMVAAQAAATRVEVTESTS